MKPWTANRLRRRSQEAYEQIQKAGALARASGRSQFENPYLRIENMPQTTGEPSGLWTRKLDAWHMGWTIENALRPNGAEAFVEGARFHG